MIELKVIYVYFPTNLSPCRLFMHKHTTAVKTVKHEKLSNTPAHHIRQFDHATNPIWSASEKKQRRLAFLDIVKKSHLIHVPDQAVRMNQPTQEKPGSVTHTLGIRFGNQISGT